MSDTPPVDNPKKEASKPIFPIEPKIPQPDFDLPPQEPEDDGVYPEEWEDPYGPDPEDYDPRGEFYEESKWPKEEFDQKKNELNNLIAEFVKLLTPDDKKHIVPEQTKSLQSIILRTWEWDADDDMRLNTLKEYREKVANIKAGKIINKEIQNQQYAELEKNIKENKFEKIDFKKLDEYANRQKHFTFLKQDFIDLFGQFSFENEALAEMFYHVAIGMQFKDQKIMGSNGWLNVNASLIAIQNSGCLEENTLVYTKNGKIKIKDCRTAFNVLSYNFKEKRKEYKRALKIDSGIKDVYRITFEDGRIVECTEDHVFFRKFGSREASLKNLKVGTKILATHVPKNVPKNVPKKLLDQPRQSTYVDYLNIIMASLVRENSGFYWPIASSKIKSIKYIGKRHTYDLKVVDNHNFFLGNGILTHNSGKDQAIDFFLRFIDKMNICIEERNIKLEPFNYAQLSGSESMEVLLDHYPKKAKGDGDDTEGGIIKGILSSNDLLVARECSYLFKDVQGEKVQKRELFLQALESKPIEKTLVKWNGNWTKTETNLAFIGTSRPFHNMKSHIAESGFQQRCLNYCANIPIERIKRMVYKAANSKLRDDKEKQRLESMIKDLASRFLDIRIWLQNTEIKVEPNDVIAITNLTGSWLIDKLEDIEREVASKEHESILSSFVSRFSHHLLVLAYHNAASEKRDTITIKDFYLALALLNDLYTTFSDWMYEYIPEDKALTAKEAMQSKIIRQYFVNNDPEDVGIDREKVVKNLAKMLRLSESYTNIILYKFSSEKFNLVYPIDGKLKLQHANKKKESEVKHDE